MRARRAIGFALACAAGGCGGARARELAVTVTEPAWIACEPVSSGTYDAEGLRAIASQRELAWEKLAAALPPEPLGRTLRVVEEGGVVRAWFDDAAGGAPPSWQAAAEAPGFLGPAEVYRGPRRDDYVEGTYEELLEPAPVEPEGRAGGTTGPSLGARGVLTITIDGDGVLGRVRRTDTDYDVRTALDAADTHLECARNLAIEGAEID